MQKGSIICLVQFSTKGQKRKSMQKEREKELKLV
jgi:hypothetical protein